MVEMSLEELDAVKVGADGGDGLGPTQIPSGNAWSATCRVGAPRRNRIGQGKVRQDRATAACGRWCRMRRPGRGRSGQGARGVRTVSSDASVAYSVRRRARALSVACSVVAFEGELSGLFWFRWYRGMWEVPRWASNT